MKEQHKFLKFCVTARKADKGTYDVFTVAFIDKTDSPSFISG